MEETEMTDEQILKQIEEELLAKRKISALKEKETSKNPEYSLPTEEKL
jgi:hypothetical protein